MINRKQFLFLSSAAAAFMLTIAACSASAQSGTVKSSSDSGISEEASFNNLPSDIQITVYQGAGFQPNEDIALSELLAQGKPVVLNFWAGLCPPCRLEMPDLQSVNDKFQDSVLLFGLDVGPFTGLGSNEDGRALLQELFITYPAGTTPNINVMRDYKILGMPTTYFITPEGDIHETWTGLLTEDKLTELVEGLLTASANP